MMCKTRIWLHVLLGLFFSMSGVDSAFSKNSYWVNKAPHHVSISRDTGFGVKIGENIKGLLRNRNVWEYGTKRGERELPAGRIQKVACPFSYLLFAIIGAITAYFERKVV